MSVNSSGSSTPNWTICSSGGSPVATTLSYTPSSLQTGDNYFYVTIINISNCTSLPDSINYYLSDLTGMVGSADFETCLGSEAELSASGGITYLWNPNPDLSDETISNPTVSINGADNYIVQIINADGCIVIDSVNVNLLPTSECLVEVYNAFSPNGDGINDFWEIDGIEGYLENEVIIFNRWGDKLIQIDNYNNNDIVWDGKTPDGKIVPSGTYYYVVNVNGDQNQAGWVQVVK